MLLVGFAIPTTAEKFYCTGENINFEVTNYRNFED
jgi:hypothetical protein